MQRLRSTGVVGRLMEISGPMPMKQINVNGKPYLQRYYAGTLQDGRDVWLHRFLSADGDRHLHNHPFEAESIVLSGGYAEEMKGTMLPRTGCVLVTSLRELMAVASAYTGLSITPFRWHRIASVEPDTWTLMVVKPDRLPYWYFRDDEGDLESVPASPREWWRGFYPRGFNEGDAP